MTAPGRKCLFHVPDPLAKSLRPRTENWLAIERWANETLRSCFCHQCDGTVAWSEDCRLHIPHPKTDSPDEEEQNWLELERWVVRLGQCGCGPSETDSPPPEPT